MKFFKQNSKKELFFQILLILNTLLLITLIIFVTIDAQDNMWRHVKTLQEVDDIKIQLKKSPKRVILLLLKFFDSLVLLVYIIH